jgi:AraC family transcriptional regulator of adaptative response / DNA-3-methyladenine glycosylase II
VDLDRELCLRAIEAKDARFDGWFVTAVRSTGIYCRPSCPAPTPRPENVRFLATAAAAQAEGFRACKRCRPDAAPGSPEWNHRADLTARAVRLIEDGVVDREGVPGLARRLGYSVRQIERQLTAELGAGPLAFARARRARTARLLVENTDLPMAEIAFAAGFSSVRSFNDTVRAVFAVPPSALRHGPVGGARAPGATVIELRLPFRAPLCPDNLFGHLAATAVPGVEEWRDGAYRCSLRLPAGTAIATLTPRPQHVACRLMLTDLRDLAVAVARCRWLLDLDADAEAVDACLRADDVLTPLVGKDPGRRVPRTAHPTEFALRAVLGQQVSTAAARTHTARLVRAHGTVIDDPEGGLTHLFPTAEQLADLDPEALALPRSRRGTVIRLVRALADGALDLGPGCDWSAARARLAALPGIGPWTIETVAMRALGDPDAFGATDLGVRQAAERLGLPTTPGGLTARAARWRPWRAYAVQHLWATGDHAVNRLPA